MKKFLLIVVFVIAKLFSHAQPFGNEWIDYSQPHWKFYVSQDSFYRITSGAIQTSFGLGINNAQWALYHNGMQVPIYISSAGNIFQQGDYIEFYGYKNIGDVDSVLYQDGDMQPHPYYSLFTDASAYYLTLRSGGNNARFTDVTNNLTSLPPKEDFYMHTKRVLPLTSNGQMRYFEGKTYTVSNEEVFKSLFEEGEGFLSNTFFGTISGGGQVTQYDVTLTANDLYSSGSNATIKTVFVTRSGAPDNHDVRIKLNGQQILAPGSSSGFKQYKLSYSFPASQLTNGNNTLSYTDAGLGISSKQNVVALSEVTYPHTFNFGAKSSFLFSLSSSGTKKYIEVTNFNDLSTTPVLYDLTNGIRIVSTQAPGTSPIKFGVPPSAANRVMLLRADTAATYKTVPQLTAVPFINYSSLSNQANYLIITDPLKFDDGFQNWAEAYRAYRDSFNSILGSSLAAYIYDINQLYEQFGYGVQKSPLAIRNFIQYAQANFSQQFKPKFVLLLGKGREFNVMRYNTTASNQCIVPTFGYPGSDNLLPATRTSDFTTCAIGRIAAETPQEVKDYLTKVKVYEDSLKTYDNYQTIPPKLYQKQVLHFSGGTGASEQLQFQYYLSQYKQNYAIDTLWGTNVTTYSKDNDQPISYALSEIIKGKINEGVSLITFFGHSATGAFDLSIDEPENYENYGKYPFILSNGCFSGFIHDASPAYSERFVLEGGIGAIGFMATSSLSISTGLHNFSDNFYKEFCKNSYRKTIGECVRATLSDIYSNPSADDFTDMVAYEMTLHCDPAVPFNEYPKPDYAVDQSSVFFNPAIVTPGIDSFEVNLVVTNLGKAIKDSIEITLTRRFFDANNNHFDYTYTKKISAPYYRDTCVFRLPVNVGTLGTGDNQFFALVESAKQIDEMAECNNGTDAGCGNNFALASIHILSDDIIPIYPYEFAIVPQQGITLKASTINPFAAPRNYTVEIDTSELFTTTNPLYHQSTTVFQGGGVVHWKPTLNYIDSTVYYWRVGKGDSGSAWHYSSFIYLLNEYPGWNQSHYYQWKKDDFVNVNIEDSDRIFKFPPSVNEIHVRTGNGIDFETMGWDYNQYNEYRWRMGGCGFLKGITFAVIDNTTGLPWVSKNVNPVDNFGDKFGNYHCSDKAGIDQAGFDFSTNGTHPSLAIPWSDVIRNFIDSIPTGFYVLIYSTNAPSYASWDATLVNALVNLGFVQAQSLANGSINGPFMFFTQNGSFTPFSYVQDGYSPPLDTSVTFNGNWYQGFFTSPKIGPAFEWGSVHWREQELGLPHGDSVWLDIIGVNANGIETTLKTVSPVILMQGNDIYLTGFDTIPASVYPYLKLRLRTFDINLRTPTQLYYWRVLYKKPPEAAVNPAAWFQVTSNMNIGSPLHFEIALENVSDVDMDSMLCKYTLRDVQLNNSVYQIRYDTLAKGDTMILIFDRVLNSTNFVGTNKLALEANPDNDQLEQYHFNNFAEINFTAGGDRINPLLDVTFDGQHIMNGDIVSSKPTIIVTLKDENKFRALNDTAGIVLYLKYPNDPAMHQVYYDNVTATFYPADSTNLISGNKATVEMKPVFTVDGTYELLVQDHDRSGNNSATTGQHYENNRFYDYKISFEVITKPMITNVLNYPNPFSTSTKFLFTITGNEIPDNLKIQIMTIKGTVVKEIFKEDLGALHIGRNITEYAWDGRDQYGDLLANGIYFYRVTVRLDDKEMDHMGMSYDKFFKKGFGKLAIIR